MSNRGDFFTGGPAFARSFRLFAELDFDTDIVYARNHQGKVVEFVLPHADYDGFTGFTHLLSEHKEMTGQSFPPIPKRKHRFFLVTLFKRIGQYFRTLWQFAKKSREWKRAGKSPANFITSWQFCSAEQTAKMREQARKAGVSLNSHLFYSLHKTVKPHLQSSKLPATWIIPVSLYDNAEQANGPGVRTSIMEVNVEDKDVAVDLHAKIRHEVNRETYWGTVVAVLINHVLPDSINRKILSATVATKKRVGTFSNISKWTGNEKFADEGWSIVPPVHPGQPIGCGCIEFNGKLGLGMKLDPYLGRDQAEADILMQSWFQTAIGETP